MKKKSIIATIFIVLILGGYYIYNNMFPVAEPIQYPTIEDIISIDVITDDNKENKILGTDFASLVTYISNSKPTRIMSTNESPAIKPYYKIEISTEGKTYNYYVYEDDKKLYIECPYEGIYTIDSEVVNIIFKWF